MTFPATVKILLVFAGLLLASRLGIPLGLALLGGGIAMDLWAGHAASELGAHLGVAVTSPTLWLFVAIMGLVISIGRFLTERRNADCMLGSVSRWGGRHGRVWSVMAMPSAIGLIPMAAGALMSAPFVEQATAETDRTAEWKTAVNYWFRHIWEFWWPLYPGVIVAMSVFGLEIWRFAAALVWFTPFSLAVGYWFLVRTHRDALGVTAAPPVAGSGRLAFLGALLAVIMSGAFLLPALVHSWLPGLSSEDRRLLAMVLGLLVAFAMAMTDERRHASWRTAKALVEPHTLQILFTVAGVMVFKSLLEQSGLLPEASRGLLASGVPTVIAVAALPLMAGFVTGIAVGFAATALPLVVGLMHASGSGLTPAATLVLAYVCGYVGMMLSPVHLCLVTSRDYFRAAAGPVYRHILPCCAAVTGLAVLLHAVFAWAGW